MKPVRLALVLLLFLGIAATMALPGSWRGDANAPAAQPAASRPLQPLAKPETAAMPEGLVTLHVALGSKGQAGKKSPTAWDGSVSVSSGRVHDVRVWQEDPRNSVDGSSWKLTTQRTIPWNSQQRARGHEAMPLKDGALVIELAGAGDDTTLNFETAQGDFRAKLADVPLGVKKRYLNGLVRISRMANSAVVLSSPSEDDFASAAAGPDGSLYVAYQAFTHGEGFRARPPIPEPPKDFAFLGKPAGGDQVLLLRLDGDTWTGPMAVTPPGQDVYRTATAVDGQGRAWVVWSANQDENWDIYARCFDGKDTWSNAIRLSTDAGPDCFPVAATDADGRVWIAWQAFRHGTSDIMAVRQQDDRFGEAIVVADAEANLWTPAIAAAADGQVAVVWDGYEQGNYDVTARVATGGQFGKPIVIANARDNEMRPSATFDPTGRLWIAYEQSPEGWGKDSGPMDSAEIGLYRKRTVAVRVWAETQLWEPAGNAADAFQISLKRTGPGQKLAVPRITADAQGRIWMAVRSPRLGSRVNVGTTWFEHLTWYQGDTWASEILCSKTDNILDNRPALVPLASGEIAMVSSTDGRFRTGSRLPQWFVNTLRRQGEQIKQKALTKKWPDPVNNELMMARVGPAPGDAPDVKLNPVTLGEPAGPSRAALDEAAAIARARKASASAGGRPLTLMRGEFHRHTELSGDGGGDGLLMDMWRYGVDVAGFDWIGNGDHDNGNGREYSWWICQKTTSLFTIPNAFTPMYTYERSCGYPDGHRNVVFDYRGVRPLNRLANGKGKAMDELPVDAKRPNTPDTLMLYDYLAQFDGICASHTSGTDMGTDWRDGDPKLEPIVEIYQGCRQSYEMPGAPRSGTADYAIGGWRPFGFVSLALKKGYRLGFQASSDHGSTHISYCNVWVEEPTRTGILNAMKARHIYGATDNIIADVRSGEHFMGDEFTTKEKPQFSIRLIGTQPFEKVHVIKDGAYVFSTSPDQQEVEFEWTDFAPRVGATSYYYVRGEQTDGELVWVSPMWITYEP